MEFDFDTLLTRLREQAFLNGGVKIILADKREGCEQEVCLHYEGGIVSFVEYINAKKSVEVLHEPIYVGVKKETCEAEIALQYNDSYNEIILSFANNINTTEGGMHETGFKSGLTKVLNDYARRFGILKDNDKNLSGEDVREGLTAVISVKLEDAQFEGQTKTKLGNSEMRGLVEELISTKFPAFLEENPAVARKILDKSLLASRARRRARGADPAQKPAGELVAARQVSPTARSATRPRPSCSSSRATAPAVPPSRAGTVNSRPYSRCGARCSTWKRRGLTRCTGTTSSCPSSLRSAPGSARISI